MRRCLRCHCSQQGWPRALDLVRDAPGDLDDLDDLAMAAARTVADVAAASLVHARGREESRRATEQLRANM